MKLLVKWLKKLCVGVDQGSDKELNEIIDGKCMGVYVVQVDGVKGFDAIQGGIFGVMMKAPMSLLESIFIIAKI